MTLTITVKSNWREDLLHVPHGAIYGMLFAGDRFSCCDEALVAYLDNQFVGIATISPRGEYYDGVPDIVGLYVAPNFRCRGYGLALLEAAIKRCIERELPTPIRITAISSTVCRLYERVRPELKNKTQFFNLSFGCVLAD